MCWAVGGTGQRRERWSRRTMSQGRLVSPRLLTKLRQNRKPLAKALLAVPLCVVDTRVSHECACRHVRAAGSRVEVNRWTRSRTRGESQRPCGPGMGLLGADCSVQSRTLGVFSAAQMSRFLLEGCFCGAAGAGAACTAFSEAACLSACVCRRQILSAFQLPKPRRDLQRQRRSVLGLTVS